jgi:hypothetical protein
MSTQRFTDPGDNRPTHAPNDDDSPSSLAVELGTVLDRLWDDNPRAMPDPEWYSPTPPGVLTPRIVEAALDEAMARYSRRSPALVKADARMPGPMKGEIVIRFLDTSTWRELTTIEAVHAALMAWPEPLTTA